MTETCCTKVQLRPELIRLEAPPESFVFGLFAQGELGQLGVTGHDLLPQPNNTLFRSLRNPPSSQELSQTLELELPGSLPAGLQTYPEPQAPVRADV